MRSQPVEAVEIKRIAYGPEIYFFGWGDGIEVGHQLGRELAAKLGSQPRRRAAVAKRKRQAARPEPANFRKRFVKSHELQYEGVQTAQPPGSAQAAILSGLGVGLRAP